MQIGLIISMYNELEQVKRNIQAIKNDCQTVIVIQSNPNDPTKILDKHLVDYYAILPDIAGSVTTYQNEIRKGLSVIPAKAVSRNYSYGINIAKNFDNDWWICVFGDVSITNLDGIVDIIDKTIKQGKSLAITRAVGQIFPDENCNFIRIQKSNTTSFMPQFFIVNSSLIKSGLFNQIRITNPYCTEQCLGDEVSRYCIEHGKKFEDICYYISDYAYPQFINGFSYNSDKIRLPRYIDGFVNLIRKLWVNIK